MKKFRRFITIFLAAALGLSVFGGCGPVNKNTNQSSPAQDAEGEGPDVPPADLETPPKEEPDPPEEEPDNPPEKQDDPPVVVPDDPSEKDPDDPPQKDESARYAYRPNLFEETPTVSIDTADGKNDFLTLPTDSRKTVPAQIALSDCPEEMKFAAAAQVKAYGNDGLDDEKKSVRIEFDEKESVLGLNGGQKYRSWVLLADQNDLSSLHSATAFYLGNAILGSDGLYCSDFCTVEVYLNGEYWGVYLLAEAQTAEEGRAGTSAQDGETGAETVLLEYDGNYRDEMNTPGGDPVFTVDYPTLRKYDGSLYDPWQTGFTVRSDVSEEQLGVLKSDLQNTFGILYAAAYEGRALRLNDVGSLEAADCTPREAVEAAIDLPSLVDTYILQEIACDPDVAWSGLYLSLGIRGDGKKKLVFEAPWDFGDAFGIQWNTFNGALGVCAGNSENPWLTVLIGTDWFLDAVKEKWEELKKYGVFETALSLIGTQSELSQAAYARNFTRRSGSCDGEGLIWEAASFRSQAEAADYLEDWLHARLNYLNAIFSDGSDILTGEPTAIPSSPDPSLSPYTFEAEHCAWTGTICDEDFYAGASGGKYLGQIETSKNDHRITLRVFSAEEQTAYLSVGLSKRSFAADFSDWFALIVNGKRQFLPLRPIEACASGETEWSAWTEVFLAPVLLHAGENTITLSVVGNRATNLDYFRLYCAAPTEEMPV